MAGWSDVARIALRLPEVVQDEDERRWRVTGKAFAWERPLRRADLAELGVDAPTGPVLAAGVPDLGARAALTADAPGTFFATAHFARYPIVLVQLAEIGVVELTELLGEAWACRAPRRLITGRNR